MRVFTSLMLVVAGTTALILAGCGDDNGMTSRESALVARTVPSAGETAYDPAAPIHIKFSTAMDTSRFHERFFFLDASMHDGTHDSLGQGTMSDSTMAICDSMARGMMGGGMDQMMGMMDGMMGSMMDGMMGGGLHRGDTAALYRGMHERAQGGQFQWNAMRDSCVFTPDAPMMSDRDYVIMMRSMAQSMHNGQHGMLTNGDAEDMMIRFHTR